MNTSTLNPSLNDAMLSPELTLNSVDPSAPATPGMPPLRPDQLDNQLGYAIGLLPDDARRAVRWLRRGRLASSVLWPTFVRRKLLQLGGVRIGRSAYGMERCWYQSPHISIGDGTGIGAECWFEGTGRIDIGANCMIGPQSMLITSIHPLGPGGEISRFHEPCDVRIGDGSWLGARVTVTPGVTIGTGVVVGAGAVVTKDCESGGVYAGVPARRIR
jgi:maltose O-acetyltransferase